MQAFCSLYFWRSLPGPECQPYSQLLILRNEIAKNRILRWWVRGNRARAAATRETVREAAREATLASWHLAGWGEAYVLVVRLRSGAAERVDFFFQERLKVGWNTVGGASEAKDIDTYIYSGRRR